MRGYMVNNQVLYYDKRDKLSTSLYMEIEEKIKYCRKIDLNNV
jgi:hypothetical protein